MRTIDVDPTPLATLAGALDEVSARRLESGAQRARRVLGGRTVWNVSATDTGGVGVLLHGLLPYAAGAGVRVGWFTLDGDTDFFTLATRLNHALHGRAHDGDGIGPDERADYERCLALNLAEVAEQIRPGDVVVLHDPAAAGLAPELRRRGVYVVWRCHVGADVPDEVSERAWAFVEPYLDAVDRVVLTRAVYRPGFLEPDGVRVIAPSIDPLSPKNRPLEPQEVEDILRACGIEAGGVEAAGGRHAAARLPGDGAPQPDPVVPGPGPVRVGSAGSDPESGVMLAGGPVPAGARVILQLSRWDRLKDMNGLLVAFSEAFDELPPDTHLLLAGAQVDEHDAEGAEVLSHCLQIWHGLADEVRDRTHVACLPTRLRDDALLVNAVQRRATVVVQKSLAEGFGLSVAEALWKGRPVVATAVGGIQDQITHEENGLLVDDPADLEGLMRHVARLLAEPAFAEQLGTEAHDRVRREGLSDRHLLDWVDLLAELLG
ncbi:trehalose synthase [Georgenia soli]|uniref:Trehalose synthase n=1 Tax=Georgenia soli TaxID=638953 RepID=A0A2A9ENP4_9MICO|nr:glycosyltransferase [Georgenia soli]PFG40216.1 trehalose synthase [Georgenia soli]